MVVGLLGGLKEGENIFLGLGVFFGGVKKKRYQIG